MIPTSDESSELPPAFDGEPSLLLIRIKDIESTADKFAVLSEKVDALAREIERRIQAEKSLLWQRDMAAFGRDIGVILARADSLDKMLQECAESTVQYLDAAFARVWTLDENGDTLVLVASAGLYTHLDGEHGRIPVGQYKIGMIAAERRPHLTNSVIGDARIHDQAWARANHMVAFAGYPMIVDERTMGVIAIFAQHELSETTLEAMASVANSIALGIERIQAEQSVREHAEALQLADRRKDEFLAMLGHELRNPLAPVRSGIELLRLGIAGHDETLDVMNEHVQHMTRLVDDLLDVSRIMRGRIELKQEPILLDDLIKRAVVSLQANLAEYEHRLVIEHSKSALWINADPVRISQVLMNLLANAVKYTPRGGQISLTSWRDDKFAVVRIRDNGVGMDSVLLPQVFDLFSQADQSLDRSAGGLGIGLTLAKRLAELHDGAIHAQSDGLGHGSEFSVRLPLCDAPDEPADQTPVKLAEPAPEYRILVVDDSVGSAKMLCRLLSAVGLHDVKMVHDGPSAIATAKAFQPDIMFLDIGLPGLSGYEVARSLRSCTALKQTRIIALTGYGAKESRQLSHEAGFDLHLVKPIGLEQIQQLLQDRPSSLNP